MKNYDKISLFGRIDAAAQRLVDSAVFFLMRHLGLSKTMIRYALGALMITAFAAEYFLKMLHSGKPDIFLVVIIVLLLFGQHAQYIMDSQTEKSNAASPADGKIQTILPTLKGIGWLIIVAKPPIYYLMWDRLSRYEHAAFGADFIAYVTNLLLLYLVRTPKTPPPIEERKTVLIPVPIQN